MIVREKEGVFYAAETYGYSRAFMDYIKNIPIKTERGTASGRALVEGRVTHIADVRADSEYTLVEAPRLGDFRTALSVPMLREGVPIGVLVLTRSEVQPFTDKQIELVTTFADQASKSPRPRTASRLLQQWLKERPDLILMGVQLPIMDGYEVTRQIKADPAMRSIPIIAVTSHALDGEEQTARAAGCDGYVPEPYSPRQLLAKVYQYLT
jgi:CheY-like chemotaxis protein